MGGDDFGSDREVFELEDGNISAWLDQEVIMLKAFARPYKNPVELTPGTTRRLAAKLVEMADRIDELDG